MSIPKINRIFDVKHNIMHSKKASLSLSINAIVVLVLAISMLGLGLAFTKSMFKKFGEKLTVPPPDLPATKDDPIVLPSEELEIRHGEEFTFQVNYFNDYAAGIVAPAVTCGAPLDDVITSIDTYCKATAGGSGKDCDVVVAKQKVDAGNQKSFKFIVPKDATAGQSVATAVCEVKFCAPDPTGKSGSYQETNLVNQCNNGENYEKTKQITIRIT